MTRYWFCPFAEVTEIPALGQLELAFTDKVLPIRNSNSVLPRVEPGDFVSVLMPSKGFVAHARVKGSPYTVASSPDGSQIIRIRLDDFDTYFGRPVILDNHLGKKLRLIRAYSASGDLNTGQEWRLPTTTTEIGIDDFYLLTGNRQRKWVSRKRTTYSVIPNQPTSSKAPKTNETLPSPIEPQGTTTFPYASVDSILGKLFRSINPNRHEELQRSLGIDGSHTRNELSSRILSVLKTSTKDEQNRIFDELVKYLWVVDLVATCESLGLNADGSREDLFNRIMNRMFGTNRITKTKIPSGVSRVQSQRLPSVQVPAGNLETSAVPQEDSVLIRLFRSIKRNRHEELRNAFGLDGVLTRDEIATRVLSILRVSDNDEKNRVLDEVAGYLQVVHLAKACVSLGLGAEGSREELFNRVMNRAFGTSRISKMKVPSRVSRAQSPRLRSVQVPDRIDQSQTEADVIQSFEEELRDFVAKILEEQHGIHWHKKGIPEDVNKVVLERKGKAIARHPYMRKKIESDPKVTLSYTDMMHLARIITWTNNWDLFKEIFQNQNFTNAKMDQIQAYRNEVMHTRDIDDLVRQEGRLAISWFRKCINAC